MKKIESGQVAGADTCPFPHKDTVKVYLKLIASQYETNGFPAPSTIEALNARYAQNPDQRAIDLYALSVPIVRDIVASAREKRNDRPPYGLIHRFQGGTAPVTFLSTGDPYGHLRDAMISTLMESTDQYFDPRNLEEKFAREPHARRNHEVYSILAKRDSGSEKNFVINGIYTGANIMPEFLRLIPNLYRRQFHETPQPEDAAQIATDNYKFISRLAIAHLVSFVRLTDKVGGRDRRQIQPEYCEYSENTDYASGLEVIFTDDTRKAFEKTYDTWLNDPVDGYRLRMGCIAIHSDAMRSLWDWHVDIGREIYNRHLPSLRRNEANIPVKGTVVPVYARSG